MKITELSSFALHVPVTGSGISDSTHSISHWGVVGACVELADGVKGYGFTGTHAHLASDRLIAAAIDECYAPLLRGVEFSHPAAHHRALFRHPPLQWVGRAGILQLALSSIDVALWDAYAKSLGAPLWRVLGGSAREHVAAYNTDVGWLSFSERELAQNIEAAVDKGFSAVKIKVGGRRLEDDISRCRIAREAAGSAVTVATDANGKWDLPTAQRFARETRDLDLLWIEEPLWYDDVETHAELARSTDLPIALGEQIYNPQSMAQFIHRGAVHYVQPDVTRIGGVTGFLDAAGAARASGLPIAAHAGDMSQVHQHLAYALPEHTSLEFIPWIATCFEEPARVESGHFVRPEQPGAATTPTGEAFDRYRVL